MALCTSKGNLRVPAAVKFVAKVDALAVFTLVVDVGRTWRKGNAWCLFSGLRGLCLLVGVRPVSTDLCSPVAGMRAAITSRRRVLAAQRRGRARGRAGGSGV